MFFPQITPKGVMYLPLSQNEKVAVSNYLTMREHFVGSLLVVGVSIASVIAGFFTVTIAFSDDTAQLAQFIAGVALVLLGLALLSYVGSLMFSKSAFIRAMRKESRIIDLQDDDFGIGLRRAIFFGEYALETFDNQRQVLSCVPSRSVLVFKETHDSFANLRLLGTLLNEDACAELAKGLQPYVANIQSLVAPYVKMHGAKEQFHRDSQAAINEMRREDELKMVRQVLKRGVQVEVGAEQ